MSTTRYFTHVDKFCDGTAYIEVGDFGTRIVSASGAREDSTWTLDECMGNCLEGAWRELSEADVIVLNIPSAPVDPRDATIAALRAELERKDAALRDFAAAWREVAHRSGVKLEAWEDDEYILSAPERGPCGMTIHRRHATVLNAALQPKEPPCQKA